MYCSQHYRIVLFWTKEIPIGRVKLVEEEVLSDLRRSRDKSRGVFVTKTKWIQETLR
jgi:hypothetical protein